MIELPVDNSNALWDAIKDSTYRPVLVTEVTALAAQSPAELAGIRDGDLVYAVDGETVTVDRPLNELVSERLGQELTLALLRDGEWHEIKVTPRVDPPPGEGALGVQISYINRMATMGMLPALREGLANTGSYAGIVLSLPVLLVQGQITPEQAQVSGPVGIAQMVGGAVSATIDTGFWFPILRLSAVLSAALGHHQPAAAAGARRRPPALHPDRSHPRPACQPGTRRVDSHGGLCPAVGLDAADYRPRPEFGSPNHRLGALDGTIAGSPHKASIKAHRAGWF